jgi:hypothetical protein
MPSLASEPPRRCWRRPRRTAHHGCLPITCRTSGRLLSPDGSGSVGLRNSGDKYRGLRTDTPLLSARRVHDQLSRSGACMTVPARRRRGFATIRRLRSGRYQVSYIGPDGRRHTAPATFQARGDAEQWGLRCTDRHRPWDLGSAATDPAADAVVPGLCRCLAGRPGARPGPAVAPGCSRAPEPSAGRTPTACCAPSSTPPWPMR